MIKTLLEFVALDVMGPPLFHDVSGLWYYRCPFHYDTNASLVLRREGSKPRYKCYGCGEYGDEFDLLKQMRPKWDYGDRKEYIARMTATFQTTVIPSEGEPQRKRKSSLEQATEWAWAEWHMGERTAHRAMEIAEQYEGYGVTWNSIMQYDVEFQQTMAEMEQRHLETCDDPDCDARVCRINRGLPPLTKEEIDADIAADAEYKAKQKAKAKKAMERGKAKLRERGIR